MLLGILALTCVCLTTRIHIGCIKDQLLKLGILMEPAHVYCAATFRSFGNFELMGMVQPAQPCFPLASLFSDYRFFIAICNLIHAETVYCLK